MKASTSPRLSIGLPVYNGERYLALALDSILAQTFDDFEVIISDNASTDSTPEICAKYVARDARVSYLRFDENLGAARNYNRTVELARGEFFKWASHDDICEPRFFECCICELDSHPEAVLAYPQTTLINAEGVKVRMYDDDLNLHQTDPAQRFERFLNIYRYPHMCNPIFGIMRLEVLRQTPLIGAFVSSDMTLLGELVLWGEIHEIPEPLFLRRDHPKASVRAYPKYRDRIAWFDPALRNRLQMTRWQWLSQYARAIRNSPLTSAKKRELLLLLLRWMGWNSKGLSKDLLKAGLWPFVQLSTYIEGE